MVKQLRRGLLALAAALLAVVSCAPWASAQSSGTANGFRVSPVRSEMTIDKGKSDTLTVTVENPTDIAMTAQSIVNDFVASGDESGSPRLLLDQNATAPKHSFKSLVGTIPNVPLGPHEKKDVAVKISVPANASAGGYYGAIRFASTGGPGNANIGLTASVGTIVLVTVPGNLVEKMSLVQLSAEQGNKPKSFLTGGDVSVLTRIKNTGDIHIKPFGHVEVKDMFGKVVAGYEFNAGDPRANILPDSVRRFDNKLDHNKWFGRYTITASLGHSQGSGDLLIAKAVFWYVPAWALYTLLAILLLIALGSFLLIRKFQGKKTLPRLRRNKK